MNNVLLPQRKPIRLKNYDYSQAGYYFVTICTENRKNMLCSIKGEDLKVYPDVELTPIGFEIADSLRKLDNLNKNIKLEQYVIMPNHIHIIISFHEKFVKEENASGLQDIICRIKSYTTNRYNKINSTKGIPLWQRSFYDHIVRSESELLDISQYIENNPLKWREDRYYEP